MRDFRMAALGSVALVTVVLTSPACAQSEFTGAGETSELDCAGGGATIEGADNVLTITGACTSLTVTGASNRITIDLAKTAVIRVVGAGNEIQWQAPGAAKPRLSVTGAANRISRRR